LPIATFICDAKGTILQYNHHAVAVWGGAPSPGQTHEQLRESARFFELDGTPVERSLVAEVLETGNSVCDVERSVEYADGSTLIVSVNIDPLRNTKGELVGAVNCFLDITARKRADERSRLHALEPSRCRQSAETKPLMFL
jgi:PAS domain S-box-containing protein